MWFWCVLNSCLSPSLNLELWTLNFEDEAVNHWNWALIPPWGSLGCGYGLSSKNHKYYCEISIPFLPQQLRMEPWLYIMCMSCADVLSDKLLCIIPVIELTSFVIQSLKDFNGLKLRMGLTQAHLASYPGQVASYPGPTWKIRIRLQARWEKVREYKAKVHSTHTWWSFFQSGSEVVNTPAAPVPRAMSMWPVRVARSTIVVGVKEWA